ncbi:DNA adenine methylase [Methanobrevibacter boviskoreani]|jgi:DNA adenine methylase|uniref:DNA adenine methylase n=1 Tax=Methanobrevibacter boviskoreani TaxID=1348249 RepID=UPI0023F553E2|nr:Dam family site-specific DNA-(adenine-N6)-methyltransferase [Methanobrevibacter boviskoreani]MDD6256901.1 Dam family site-specific DNA-(adenine-N6)-methyltransferase [Methanobrevibacter boviskoreani]MDY5614737.1 Dam family site-specific DNA-(adenine-N6)-methyltransferase [Methanobrevibacter boviskoreani]
MKLVDDNINATPFLKWAGGKKQLLPTIQKRLPENILSSGKIEEYFEPFIGGGAVFFYLMSNYEVKHAYISDINEELILTYDVIKKDYKELTERLKILKSEYMEYDDAGRKKMYLNIRLKFNQDLKTFDFDTYDESNIERASYTIFMNKTGFNGLFRLNKKGEFNVPAGKYKNPNICDADNLKNVHKVLKKTDIKCASFSDSEDLISESSFVYLDPPYRPLSGTSNFNTYYSVDFDDVEQIELSKFYKRINDKGAKIMLSNSDPHNTDPDDDFFDDLYKDFNIERVKARRSINSNGAKRGAINELLIRNY